DRRLTLEDGDDYPNRLSDGQQQRVAIARAILTRPRAVLLDEVTSALNPELVGEVLEVIRELKTEGMTLLIATHEMALPASSPIRCASSPAGGSLSEDHHTRSSPLRTRRRRAASWLGCLPPTGCEHQLLHDNLVWIRSGAVSVRGCQLSSVEWSATAHCGPWIVASEVREHGSGCRGPTLTSTARVAPGLDRL
ncbi:MAG: ATP-binding cassette domain-containing protein, partial [Myxococcaceae bacterium]